MRFEANRNWFLIALAIGSPYYWGQYMLAKSSDATTVTISALFGIVAVILLFFLLRKQYIEVQNDRIIMQTPFRRREWRVEDFRQVSIQEKVVSAFDQQGKFHYLMIPQKPDQFKQMQQAIYKFCKHNKVPVTDKELPTR